MLNKQTIKKRYKDVDTKIIDDALKIVEYSHWNYFGRRMSNPNRNVISVNSQKFAEAVIVFEIMQLNLEKLSQIFVREKWEIAKIPFEEREKQPIVKSYSELGSCRIEDVKAWQELSNITNKTIRLIFGHGEPTGDEVAVYHPDMQEKKQ